MPEQLQQAEAFGYSGFDSSQVTLPGYLQWVGVHIIQ